MCFRSGSLVLRVSVIDERKAENGAFGRDVAGWIAVQARRKDAVGQEEMKEGYRCSW